MNKLFLTFISILIFSIIQESNAQDVDIPDTNFLKKLLIYDTNKDGKIQKSEVSNVSSLDLTGSFGFQSDYIKSLKGIEVFVALETLHCGFNSLTSLDVSNNRFLKELICWNNQLTSLDISNNIFLTDLHCGGNQLTSLDVSKNTALAVLRCDINKLSSLDVSKNIALTSLGFPQNQLTNLDVSQNTALAYLECDNNQLTYLDISKNFSLKELRCGNNQLASLDVSKNLVLTDLYCGSNQLTSLDVSKNTALTRLDCSENQLTSLDVSNNTVLRTLNCYKNNLIKLDVSANIELDDFTCSDNQLTYLNLGNISKLRLFWCGANKLTSLDLSKNTALTTLNCDENQLTSLDVSKNTSLTSLNCSDNQIASLDVSNNIALTNLNCGYNQLIGLDISRNIALVFLECTKNKLASLDVSRNTSLVYLECAKNKLASLNVYKNTYLVYMICDNNQLASLDISNNTSLEVLACHTNSLKVLDVRTNTKLGSLFAKQNPDLKNICIRNSQLTKLDSTSSFKIRDASDTVGLFIHGMEYSIKDSILTYKLWQKDTSAVWNTKCDGEILPMIYYAKPVCQRANLQLTCTTVKGAAYLWRGPNGFSSTEYNPNLFNLSLADSGWYSVRITLPSGDTVSVREKIYVSPSPESISLNSQTPDHCSKDYTMKVESKDTLSYHWFFNAKKMQQAQGMTLQPPLTGVYSVIGYNAQGCGASSLPLYVDVDSATVPDLIKLRNPARLKAPLAAQYQWFVDNYYIANSNVQELPLIYNGTYKVQIINTKGCVSYSPEYEIFDDNLPSLRTEMLQNGQVVIDEFSGLNIVPQPAQDEANITWSSPKRGMVTIELVNASGQIASKTIASKENEVFVYRLAAHDFTSGLYLLRLSCEDKQVTKQILLSK